MKIAVTGASGHLGNVLVAELLAGGHEISILTHKHSLRISQPGIRQVNGSVTNPDALAELIKGSEAVIHAAAIVSVSGKDHDLIRSVNVEGTRLMLETAWRFKIKKFVHISSIHAFEQKPSDKPLNENRTLVNDEASAYDLSKREGQQLALQFAKQGMNVTIVNPTSIVGPPDYGPSLMGQAIIGLSNRKIPAILDGGFDFVDVRDVSNAIVAALYNGRNGACYLLSGKWYSISQIAGMLSEISGKRIALPVVPEWIARLGVPFIRIAANLTGKEPLYTNESINALISGNRFIDSTKAIMDLDFSPRAFHTTLVDSYNWFAENGFIRRQSPQLS